MTNLQLHFKLALYVLTLFFTRDFNLAKNNVIQAFEYALFLTLVILWVFDFYFFIFLKRIHAFSPINPDYSAWL